MSAVCLAAHALLVCSLLWCSQLQGTLAQDTTSYSWTGRCRVSVQQSARILYAWILFYTLCGWMVFSIYSKVYVRILYVHTVIIIFLICTVYLLSVKCTYHTHVHSILGAFTILSCDHLFLEFSSMYLQIHSPSESLHRWGETGGRLFSWCGAVLPIWWVASSGLEACNCWAAKYRFNLPPLCVCCSSSYFLVYACMHPPPSLLSCRGCVWNSVCISVLHQAVECANWLRCSEECLQVRTYTCIEPAPIVHYDEVSFLLSVSIPCALILFAD